MADLLHLAWRVVIHHLPEWRAVIHQPVLMALLPPVPMALLHLMALPDSVLQVTVRLQTLTVLQLLVASTSILSLAWEATVLHHPERTHHLEAMAATHHPEAMVLHPLVRIHHPEAIHLTELQAAHSVLVILVLLVCPVPFLALLECLECPVFLPQVKCITFNCEERSWTERT